MKLSIIIVNYMTGQITIDCLRSLEKYPFHGAFEVIIIDNASGDGSPEEIGKTFGKYKNFTAKLIKNKKNLGFSKANNQGIKAAKGKYALLLNSDTIMKRGVLDSMVSFADSTADAGVVAPKLLNSDGSTQASVFRLPTLSRAIKQYIFGRKGLLDKYAPTCQKPCRVESVVGAVFLITPKALERAGLLDERYFMYFEDIEYCRRVQQKGLGVYYLPNLAVTHLHGASGKSSAQQMERLVSSSKVYHGLARHHAMQLIIRTGRYIDKLLGK